MPRNATRRSEAPRHAAELARRQLAAILRLAYSGELAAALAYRGHWRSARAESDRASIREIEADELRHRAGVRRMLDSISERPSVLRECYAHAIGRVLGALCHVAGFFAPMYGAGVLERRNVCEFESAARLAALAGRSDFVADLREMEDVERDHEAFFRARVMSHRWSRWVPVWPAPPEPRSELAGVTPISRTIPSAAR